MQMQAMINYRISVARDFATAPSLFTIPGFMAVYLATGGYPRKVVFLCHHVVLKMIVRGRKRAGWFLVRSCINEIETPLFRRLRWAMVSLIALLLMVSAGAFVFQLQNADASKKIPAVSSSQAVPVPVSSVIQDVKQAGQADAVNLQILPESNIQNIKMPDYIGKIPMTKRRTIWWTLNNIYGDMNPGIMQAVYTANPHVKNKDVVNEGTIITLPSLPDGIRPVGEGEAAIALKSGKDLETMYNNFRNNPDWRKMPPLAFLSFWNKKEGMEFAIVIDKSFRNDKSAEEALGKLPKAVAPEARILSRWDADTVFFNRRALQH
jgi:general secretion pathway protein A